jgi:hypothetical protein
MVIIAMMTVLCCFDITTLPEEPVSCYVGNSGDSHNCNDIYDDIEDAIKQASDRADSQLDVKKLYPTAEEVQRIMPRHVR